jgi:hypothetical protein
MNYSVYFFVRLSLLFRSFCPCSAVLLTTMLLFRPSPRLPINVQ